MTTFTESELECWGINELIEQILMLQQQVEQAQYHAREILTPKEGIV